MTGGSSMQQRSCSSQVPLNGFCYEKPQRSQADPIYHLWYGILTNLKHSSWNWLFTSFYNIFFTAWVCSHVASKPHTLTRGKDSHFVPDTFVGKGTFGKRVKIFSFIVLISMSWFLVSVSSLLRRQWSMELHKCSEKLKCSRIFDDSFSFPTGIQLKTLDHCTI